MGYRCLVAVLNWNLGPINRHRHDFWPPAPDLSSAMPAQNAGSAGKART
jgi:hypothetical protein